MPQLRGSVDVNAFWRRFAAFDTEGPRPHLGGA
jgi:hypothetical protein